MSDPVEPLSTDEESGPKFELKPPTLRGEPVTIPTINASRSLRALDTLSEVARDLSGIPSFIRNYDAEYRANNSRQYEKNAYEALPEDERAKLEEGQIKTEIEIEGNAFIVHVPERVPVGDKLFEVVPVLYDKARQPLLEYVCFVLQPTERMKKAAIEGQLETILREEAIGLIYDDDVSTGELINLVGNVLKDTFEAVQADDRIDLGKVGEQMGLTQLWEEAQSSA